MSEHRTIEQHCEHDWLDMHEPGHWRFVCQKCGANKQHEQLPSNPQFVCREGHNITPDGALKIRKLEKDVARLTAELAATQRALLNHECCGDVETERDRLAAIVDIVRVARKEGWYEDNSGWEAVDKLLAGGAETSPVDSRPCTNANPTALEICDRCEGEHLTKDCERGAVETSEGPETGAAGPNHIHEWIHAPHGYEKCYCGAKR